jgi:hypothetical protein
MNKLSLASFAVFFISIANVFPQDSTKEFEILLPENKIPNSLYSSIDVIDSRIDKSHIGIVQVGALNRKAKVVLETPFLTQLEKVIYSLTDSTASKGKLLFHLRQLTFAEITGAMSEKGYCYMRAALYSRNDQEYRKLAAIDTVVLIKSMDVTKSLLRNGSKLVTNFIASSLHLHGKDTVSYGYNDIVKMDSIEKRKLVVYNTEKYAEGLYYNYESFKNQMPDKQITVKKKKDGSISAVSTLETNGKPVKIKPKDTYAFVYEGNAFIATEYGFYPLNKTNDDFYFIGQTKVSANSTDVIGATILFGLIGGLLASDTNATFVMKVDHINGGFIHLREVKTHSK